ncbi:hypothetical protein ACLOJK_009486 [Asimina triloba]
MPLYGAAQDSYAESARCLLLYDDDESKRSDKSLKAKQECLPTSATLKERQAAYLAARERIFAMDENQLNETSPPKQRNVPVVARRMIAHALGQRISVNTPCEQSTSSAMNVRGSNNAPGDNADTKGHSNPARKADHTKFTSNQSPNMHRNRNEKPGSKCPLDSEFPSRKKTHSKEGGSEISLSSSVLQSGSNSKDNLKREHYGAAKRMFAQALGLPPNQDAKHANYDWETNKCLASLGNEIVHLELFPIFWLIRLLARLPKPRMDNKLRDCFERLFAELKPSIVENQTELSLLGSTS